jgi:hypothetical protein
VQEYVEASKQQSHSSTNTPHAGRYRRHEAATPISDLASSPPSQAVVTTPVRDSASPSYLIATTTTPVSGLASSFSQLVTTTPGSDLASSSSQFSTPSKQPIKRAIVATTSADRKQYRVQTVCCFMLLFQLDRI